MIKMSIPAQPNKELKPNIVVIGVGGAGGNAVDNMIASELEGVNFVVCNTDAQALTQSLCEHRVQLGTEITQGLGAGSDPSVGRAAAEESIEDVMSYLDGMNMAFITCGMGGGTGTGAAPVIARAARERGILTVGVITKPFQFEGANRMRLAEEGIEEMQEYVDTLIIIPNQNLFRIANEKTTFSEAFKMADGVLQSGVRGVTDLMVKPGMINLDFADVRCTMREMGKAMMGTGEATGDNRALEAAEAAINNPLLDDVSMKGARGVIINITGGYDMTLMEVNEVCNRIGDEVDDQANIIFGSTFDDRLEGTIRVSVVATGIEGDEVRNSKPLRPAIVNSDTGTTRDEKSLHRATPLASSIRMSNTDGEKSSLVTGHAGQTGQGKMPSSLPSGSNNTYQDMPAQKVAGSDVNYDAAHALSATDSANSRFASGHTMQTAPHTAAAASQTQTGYAEALRGERHGSSFIPPRAAQATDMKENNSHDHMTNAPTAQQATNTPFGFASPMQAPSMMDTRTQNTNVQPNGLKLNPPKLPTPDNQAHKAPSLFERMTGMVRQITGQDETDDFAAPTQAPKAPQHNTTPTQSAPTGYAPTPSQQGQNHNMDNGGYNDQLPHDPQAPHSYPPVQGQLDINIPAQPEKAGGDKAAQTDLDIPAFLRRQAN